MTSQFSWIFVLIITIMSTSAFIPRAKNDFPTKKTSRIFGGFDARKGQFPYTVSILNREKMFFGGSLISSNVVLTIASETQYKDPFIVYLGTQTARDPRTSDGVVVNATEYMVHKNFDSVDHENDIALIYLPGFFHITGVIEPIRLPALSQLSFDYSDEIATLSGVGVTTSGDKVNMQFLKLRVLRFEECQEDWTLGEVFNTQVCTKSRGTSFTPCHGDQGGPLTVEETDGLPTQIGISSLFNCARDYPHLYTKTASYLEWIATNGGPPVRQSSDTK